MSQIIGCIAFICFVLNTIFWGVLILVLTPFKSLAPKSPGGLVARAMVGLAENWISVNSAGIALLHKVDWDVQGLEGLDPEKSYLVSANHRSWVDIVVLQKIFNRRIPFMRFFLKHQLKAVPLLGVAWWALDFPFMKRYSKEYLARHPEKRGEDFETIRRTCERFKGSPISILNFLEGTRFTEDKHASQGGEFRHLLNPKAGGLAFVLETMGQQFDSFLDVTIFYPQGDVSLWMLLSGRIRRVVVRVKRLPIPASLTTGRYLEDAEARENMQRWVRGFWLEKDAQIAAFIDSRLRPGTLPQ